MASALPRSTGGAGALGGEVPAADAADALQAAEVDRGPCLPDPFKNGRRSACLEGFSPHAGVQIHAQDREGLERLCRYALRVPLVLHRLSPGPDGTVTNRMSAPGALRSS